MKKISLLIAFSALLFLGHSQTEEKHENTGKKIPSVSLKNMAGKTVNTADMGLKGPIVISFWETWCAPCKKELNEIQEVDEDGQQEKGVTLVAVSVDDEKTKSKVTADENEKG